MKLNLSHAQRVSEGIKELEPIVDRETPLLPEEVAWLEQNFPEGPERRLAELDLRYLGQLQDQQEARANAADDLLAELPDEPNSSPPPSRG